MYEKEISESSLFKVKYHDYRNVYKIDFSLEIAKIKLAHLLCNYDQVLSQIIVFQVIHLTEYFSKTEIKQNNLYSYY